MSYLPGCTSQSELRWGAVLSCFIDCISQYQRMNLCQYVSCCVVPHWQLRPLAASNEAGLNDISVCLHCACQCICWQCMALLLWCSMYLFYVYLYSHHKSWLPDFIVHIDRFVVWLEDMLFIVIVRVQKISSCLIFVLILADDCFMISYLCLSLLTCTVACMMRVVSCRCFSEILPASAEPCSLCMLLLNKKPKAVCSDCSVVTV